MKKRFDRQHIHKVGFVVDRFVQALECQIEVSHPDCSETLCQWSDVLLARELMQSLDTFLGSRKSAFPGVGCGKQTDIQWRGGRRETLYRRVEMPKLEVQESFIQSRIRIVAIQLDRLPEMFCRYLILFLYVMKISHPHAVAGREGASSVERKFGSLRSSFAAMISIC